MKAAAGSVLALGFTAQGFGLLFAGVVGLEAVDPAQPATTTPTTKPATRMSFFMNGIHTLESQIAPYHGADDRVNATATRLDVFHWQPPREAAENAS